jgi:collagenase-like PrtC family protease
MPIDKIEEIKPFALAGADEFFCGVFYKNKRISSRPPKEKYNLKNLKELSEAVKLAHSYKKEIWLALNSRNFFLCYIENPKMLDEIFSQGIDGIIISDLALLAELSKRKDLKVKIALSTILPTFNSDAVNFLKQFKVDRIILDRLMTLEEINNIVKRFEDLDFEVFGFGSVCFYVNAFCSFRRIGLHHYDYKKSGNPEFPCSYHFDINMDNYFSSNKLAKKERDKIINFVRKRSYQRSIINCPLCALEFFYNSRNRFILKTLGRGRPLKTKLKLLESSKKALRFLENNNLYYTDFCQKEFNRIFEEKCKQRHCMYS